MYCSGCALAASSCCCFRQPAASASHFSLHFSSLALWKRIKMSNRRTAQSFHFRGKGHGNCATFGIQVLSFSQGFSDGACGYDIPRPWGCYPDTATSRYNSLRSSRIGMAGTRRDHMCYLSAIGWERRGACLPTCCFPLI